MLASSSITCASPSLRAPTRGVSTGPRDPLCQVSLRRTKLCHAGARRSFAAVAASAPALEPLPQTCAEQVAQCAAAVRLAASPEGGSHRRQRVQLLLPINQRKSEFTSVESDDYGMNDADVYKAAMETASAMIRLVDPEGGEMSAKRVDKDNDPVGVLQNAAGTVRALVIPNAQDLDELRALAALGDANGTQITLLVNPQWVESGQIISDFGIGPWKKRAMDVLETFESTYALTESRGGAAACRLARASGAVSARGRVAAS